MIRAVLCSPRNLFSSRRYNVIVRKINDKGMKLSSDDRTSSREVKEEPMCQALWLWHAEGLTAGSRTARDSTLELGTSWWLPAPYVISMRRPRHLEDYSAKRIRYPFQMLHVRFENRAELKELQLRGPSSSQERCVRVVATHGKHEDGTSNL